MSQHRRPEAPSGSLPPRPVGGTEVIPGDVSEEWAPPPAPLPIALPVGEDRYRLERELARGSMGVVRVARDLSLQRLVAVKSLDPECTVPGAAARFLDEARITAQLSHPAIVPVYEIGVAGDGHPYFTMQLIEGRTLHAILGALRAGHPPDTRQFSRVRLLRVFIQVCMAVAYAHNRGVIHRDLKPENIMLGTFGEVFVMDWGLAKIISTDVADPIVGGRAGTESFRTRVGDVAGTPSYMCPEQAMGLIDALNARSDIYALGAILYELLTLRPPHEGATAQEILRKVRNDAPEAPSRVAPGREVPVELDAVVMRCLAREQTDRYASATDLVDEIEAWLSGGRTSMYRLRDATRAVREAARTAQFFRDVARRRRRIARDVAEAESLRLPGDAPEQVRRVWEARVQLEALEAELRTGFEGALSLFAQVLAEAPEMDEAHEGLRDLYWYRFLEAERLGDVAGMAVFRALAVQHDPAGALAAAIQGDGSLVLTSEPPGARVTLYRYAEMDRRLVPIDPRPCGTTPLALDPMPMGRYLVLLEADGFEPTRVPVQIDRQEAMELPVRLLRRGALPPGCIHVPTGNFVAGASEPELGAPPRARLRLPDFVIAREPVTVDEYAAFLADLAVRDPARARGCVPAAWRPGPDGRHHPDEHGRNPVTGVNARAALAYAHWRSERDGLPWRLPTELEWEKAARGADGRGYPWGDTWEPGFCRCADGPEGGAASPVGNDLDESPYGVRDLAGGVREWTSSEHPRDPRRRAVKGGGFFSGRAGCHLAARQFSKMDRHAPDLGFRLALDLDAVG